MRQLRQILSLRYGASRLDPWEYYFFHVYRDEFSTQEKKRFAGWRREMRLDRALNTGAMRNLANDKLAFYQYMAEHGAPQPRLCAVFSGHAVNLPGVVKLHDANDVERYLADPASSPVFIKPVRGAQGRNAYSVSAPGPDGRSLVLSSGEAVDLHEFVAGLDTREQNGWLFQERLHSDAVIARFSGNRLTSLRIIVIMNPDGPEILGAVWKIPTGNNITDNFSVGHSGNMIGGIDLVTGRIGDMVQGAGWKNIATTHHPDTGADLDTAGFVDRCLPNWNEAKASCLEYAALFPDLRLQHWDIAMTDRGPLILEINVEGGMRTHQIVNRRGIVDERLEKAAAKLGV